MVCMNAGQFLPWLCPAQSYKAGNNASSLVCSSLGQCNQEEIKVPNGASCTILPLHRGEHLLMKQTPGPPHELDHLLKPATTPSSNTTEIRAVKKPTQALCVTILFLRALILSGQQPYLLKARKCSMLTCVH